MMFPLWLFIGSVVARHRKDAAFTIPRPLTAIAEINCWLQGNYPYHNLHHIPKAHSTF